MNIPRDLRYERSDSEKYSKLKSDKSSPFYKADYKDIFLFAASYGYRQGKSKELKNPAPNIPVSAFNEEELWVLRSLAFTDVLALEAFKSDKDLFETAEEYANGGLEDIYNKVFATPGEAYKLFIQDTLDLSSNE